MIAAARRRATQVGTKAQIVAVIVAGDLPRRRARAGPPAPAGRALRAALDAASRWRCWCWRSGATGSTTLADAVGVQSPPNALFLVALGVVFVLLLHFSIATSRLSEETKILAQEVARLDAEARAAARPAPTAPGAGGGSAAAGGATAAEQPSSDDRPVGAQRRAAAAGSGRGAEVGGVEVGRQRARELAAPDRPRRLDPPALPPAARQRAREVDPGAELLAEPAAGDRDRHQGQLGGERAPGASSASSAGGIGADERRPAVALQVGATWPAPCRTRSRGRRGRRPRRRAARPPSRRRSERSTSSW